MSYFHMRVSTSSAALVLFVVLASDAVTSAAPPWEAMVPFKRIDADPNNAYPVAETNGPWMIVATTFHGENADKQAQDLVHELRRKFKLPAYSYKQRYDYSGKERGRGFDRFGRPKVMKYQANVAYDEVAVLVGDYDTIDDPRAERALQKIKYLQPEALHGEKDTNGGQAFSGIRDMYRNVTSSKENRKKGPMGHAFVATNPLLPKEYFVTPGVDKLVLEMNQGVEHCLLNCPGKYTVKVATFNGAAIVDPKKIKAIEKGKPLGSRLVDAAEDAHKLTVALRKANFEAYEFHDRDKSIVCIGSFKRVGVEHPDGRLEMDPQIRQIIDQFTADQQKIRASKDGVNPHKFADIPLDVEPQPYEVPKKSIATAYQRSMRNDF
jgi:hypothetical protein